MRESEVAQSCPTLSYPMDCSLPGSSVHGIFQARVLEWGAIKCRFLSSTPASQNPWDSFNESFQVSPLCSRVEGQSQIVCPLFPIATASLATPMSNTLMGASNLLLHLLILPFILTSSLFTHTYIHTHIYRLPRWRRQCTLFHSSTLAWKIPWMEEPGGLQSMGSLRVGYDWTTSLSLFTFLHWRRKWQSTPVFLPGESQGWGSLMGCRLWGHTE